MPVIADIVYGQLFINDAADLCGWSEGHYMVSMDRGSAFADLVKVAKARFRLLTTEYKLVDLRVSNCRIRGDSYRAKFFLGKDDNYNIQASTSIRGTPNVLAVWIHQQSFLPLVIQASRPLHGIPHDCLPDDTKDDSTEFQPTGSFSSSLRKYYNVLQGTTRLVHVAGYHCPKNAWTTLSLAIGALTDIMTVVNAASFAKARLPFVVTLEDEDIRVIQRVGTDTWRIERGFNGTSEEPHLAGTTVLGSKLDVINTELIEFQRNDTRVRSRKVGRPFGLSRGRRAKRVS